MDIIKTAAVSIIAAVIVVGGFQLLKDDSRLAGAPGISILPVSQNPTANFVLATSTVGSSILTTSDLAYTGVVAMTLTGGSGTLTFPASSSFPGIPNPGDSRVIYVRNATTSAAVSLTLAGGTGTQLKSTPSSTVLVGDTDGNNSAMVTFIRKANSDIIGLVTKFQD